MMDRAIEHTPTLLDLYMFKVSTSFSRAHLTSSCVACGLVQLATSCSTPLGSDDWHAFQARIFKHAGAPQAASEQMEIARKMDLADRYLNTKSTRYLLRAGLNEEATKTIALFTKVSQHAQYGRADLGSGGVGMLGDKHP